MFDDKYCKFDRGAGSEEITVCGIPFSVIKNAKGVVQKIQQEVIMLDANNSMPFAQKAVIKLNEECDVLFFLGMSTDSTFCSEWWAQNEVNYDHSVRVYIGDRLMRIRVIFEDNTEELISVIFGVNAWNYHLFYKPKAEEEIMCWDSPYSEPFISDPEAKALKDASLKLMENTSEDATKATKWVFAYRVNSEGKPGKKIKEIILLKEENKQANIAISAVTGLRAGEKIDESWPLLDQKFFLTKGYYKDVDRLARRLYQFRDELPTRDPKVEIEDFTAPDITFKGTPLSEVYTNVYRVNIMDMAYNKVDRDGRSHTSTPFANNFGCYLGFGTFNTGSDAYGGQVWSRDIGRTLMEIANLGIFDRLIPAADYLNQLLYKKSFRYPDVPHWKRVANLIPSSAEDHLDGKENDGHASIMLFIYTLYRKGVVGKEWIEENMSHLKAAAGWYKWQMEHPEKSNYNGIFYSESEASTQLTGGYDLFSNIISCYGLLGYARLFRAVGDEDFAGELEKIAEKTRMGVNEYFTMEHPRYGRVYTDTLDDCWTYEYKRMADLLYYSDMYGYDMARTDPVLFDLMNRTFLAQKEVFYAPESGRQMGYGQGYITQMVIMLDLYEEMADCVETAAAFCYHHTDCNYIVPEGVICHGSGAFWFRNSDLGNAVQQAETVKCARLLVGIDDILPGNAIRFVPRLPRGWQKLEAKDYKVVDTDRSVKSIDFSYSRGAGQGKVVAECGQEAYTADWSWDGRIESLRMGPFTSEDISVRGGTVMEVRKIQDNYFVYVKVEG